MTSAWRAAAIVLVAFAVRALLAWSIAPFQAPDEAAHLEYVRFLGENASLPVQPALRLDVWSDPQHQSYQPPLAYLSFVPLERVFGGASDETVLLALRLQNALYGALTALAGWLLVARLTPRGDPRRDLAAVALALLPGFVGAGAVLNNDGLSMLLASLAFLPLLGEPRRPWLAGLLLGGACLAKLTALPLVALLAAAPLLARRGVREAAIAVGVAALVLLPWLARNVVVYGQLFAVGVGSMSEAWLGNQLPAESVVDALRPRPENVWLQFWGRFGIANNLSWPVPPWVGGALLGVALVGWARARGALDDLESCWPVFAGAFALSLAGLLWFSLGHAGGWQGRYLYASALPAAVLLACGWVRALPGQASWAIAALLLALDIWLALALRAFFAATPAAKWIFPAAL